MNHGNGPVPSHCGSHWLFTITPLQQPSTSLMSRLFIISHTTHDKDLQRREQTRRRPCYSVHGYINSDDRIPAELGIFLYYYSLWSRVFLVSVTLMLSWVACVIANVF